MLPFMVSIPNPVAWVVVDLTPCIDATNSTKKRRYPCHILGKVPVS
jgi:hypothetical protein